MESSKTKQRAPRAKHVVFLKRNFEDIETSDFFWHLRFQCEAGKARYIEVLRGTAPAKVVEMLRRKGWVGTQPGTETAYIEGILRAQNKPVTKRTAVSGWHDDIYVHARQTIGASRAEFQKIKISTNIEDAFLLSSGKYELWRNELEKPCRYSYYLCFGIGVAFVGPILKFIDETEGCLFNLQGESSSGKSLTGRVCQSVFARAQGNDVTNFATTDRNLEEVCASRNDLALVLDELLQSGKSGQQLRDMMKTIAFRVAGGQGKARSSYVASKGLGLENLQWRLFGLTSSEATLDSLAGNDLRDNGEKVRHIDIPVPGTANGGIFRTTATLTGGRLAQSVEATICQNYGVIIKPYIKYLINNKTEIKTKIEATIEKFYSTSCVSEDSWERRFARKFAIVLAAMQLAIEAKVAPWTSKVAANAVEVMYRQARKRAKSDNIPFSKEIRELQKLVIDKERVPRLKERGAIPSDLKETAVGFIRPNSDYGRVFFLCPETLKEISKDIKQFISFCQNTGISQKVEDGASTVQVSVKGFKHSGKRRWYCFYKSI